MPVPSQLLEFGPRVCKDEIERAELSSDEVRHLAQMIFVRSFSRLFRFVRSMLTDSRLPVEPSRQVVLPSALVAVRRAQCSNFVPSPRSVLGDRTSRSLLRFFMPSLSVSTPAFQHRLGQCKRFPPTQPVRAVISDPADVRPFRSRSGLFFSFWMLDSFSGLRPEINLVRSSWIPAPALVLMWLDDMQVLLQKIRWPHRAESGVGHGQGTAGSIKTRVSQPLVDMPESAPFRYQRGSARGWCLHAERCRERKIR